MLELKDNTETKLRELLIDIVNNNPAEGILFSGGLDTSVLAACKPHLKAITVSLESRAQDLPYAKMVVSALGMEQTILEVGIDEAIAAIPEVIKITKSFDPALPNDLAVYFGLKKAKELGIKNILTGDASDELFGGYSFMREIKGLNAYIRRISQNMSFSSNRIADSLGLKIIQPFVDPRIRELALLIEPGAKIRQGHGKWILRKAFEGMLPNQAIWQSKRPAEYGSGFTELRRIISDKVSDTEFAENSDGISFINREHRYYYRVYKNIFGRPQGAKEKETACPSCGVSLGNNIFHCRVCGWARAL